MRYLSSKRGFDKRGRNMDLRRINKFPYMKKYKQIKNHICLLLLLFTIDRKLNSFKKVFVFVFFIEFIF